MTSGYLDPIDIVVEFPLSIHEHDLLRDNRKRDNEALGLIQQGLYDINFPKCQIIILERCLWAFMIPVIKVYPK